MTRLKKCSGAILAFVLISVLLVVSGGWKEGEVVGGGSVTVTSGGSTTGYDANPANPANWDWDYVDEAEGTTTYDIWVYVNNVPTKKVWTKEWDENFWRIDGVAQNPGITPAYGATTIYIAEEETITASSNGSFTRQMQWISPYTAPEQVLVKVSGVANHARTEGSNVSSSTTNWITSPAEEVPGGALDYEEESRENAAYILLTLDNEIATLEASQLATVTVSGADQMAVADAEYFEVELAEYAVGVWPWVGTTYRKDDVSGLPVSNVTEYITPCYMDTAVEYHDPYPGDPHWDLDTSFSKIAYGNWTDPFHEWSANGTTWEDDFFHEYEEIGTEFTYNLTDSFPRQEDVVLSITNGASPAVVRIGNLYMRVHLPAENVDVTSDIRVYGYGGGWRRVTPEYVLNPGDPPLTISETVTYSEQYTSQMSTTVGSSAGVEAAIKAQVSSSMTVALGQTAQISVTHTVNHTFPAGSPAKVWWIERRTWNREAEGLFDYYASSGFQSVEELLVNYFESGTKSAAEQLDYQEQANWRYAP
jgi:hypothetical protein